MCLKIEKQLPLPFWFAADFESILKPIDTVLPEMSEPDQPVREEDADNLDDDLRATPTHVGRPALL